MATAQNTKASDRQAVCKKLMTALKKRYSYSLPRSNRSVLESMLHAICLENASQEAGDALYEKLLDSFHDLNEIRVSSITELEQVLNDLHDPEWRALRIRAVLQFVFERHFEFSFEELRRKNVDQAQRLLARITDLSPFVRLHTLHSTLGSHVVPVDDRMRDVAVWLGLVPPDCNVEQAADALKSAVRKTDVALFTHLLRQLAQDPKFQYVLADYLEETPEDGFDPLTAPERLIAGLKDADTRKRTTKKPAKKATKTTTKKPTTKKPAAKKSAAKKTAAKKPAAKKKTKQKAAGSKATAKTSKRKTAGKSATTKKKAAKTKTRTKSPAKKKTKTKRGR